MKRHHVTLGAKTTAGGTVVSATSNSAINGKKMALENDRIVCPACDTVETLAQLQEQFKRGAWSPWTGNGSTWFDLSADGRAALRQRLSRPGWS